MVKENFGYTTIKTSCYSNFHIFYEVRSSILFYFQGFEFLCDYLHCLPLRHHTLVLGSSGQIWAFGSGKEGQIGTGQQDDVLTPTMVELPWTTDGAPAPESLYSVCVTAVERIDIFVVQVQTLLNRLPLPVFLVAIIIK